MDLSPEIMNYIEIASAILAATIINIKMVSRHLKPNGGSSLADKINQISDHLVSLDGWKRIWMELCLSPIIETDTQGHCIWVNTAFHQLTGQSLIEAQGAGWLNTVHPEDSEKVKTEWNQAILTDSSFLSSFRVVNTLTQKITTVKCKGLEVAQPGKGHGGYIVIMSS